MLVSDPDRSAAPASTTRTEATPATAETVDLRVLAPLAAWVRSTQGEAAFDALCATAGVTPAMFSNGGGLTLSQLEAWLSAVRDRIGGDGALVAASMGREPPSAATPRWLRWFATPALLYRGREGRRAATAGMGRLAVRRRGLGAAVMRYTTAEPESRVVCLWRQARVAQRPRAWGLPPAVVHETRCLARGDDACEYVVRWRARPRWTGTVAATSATIAVLVWVAAEPGIVWSLPAVAATLAHAVEVERVRRANGATAAAFGTAFRRAVASAPARPLQVDTEPVPAVAPSAPPAESEAASLRREGDVWRVSYASRTVLIRHSRGLSLLVHLLRNPGEEIHVSALDALSPSDTAMPVAASAPVDASVGDLGDAGEVLDAQAKAAYRRRLGDLREELADAEANNDLGRSEHLRAELEALADQLRQATGLGGRSRRASSNVDRVRVAVTRRIRAAITQIEKHHEALGAHLGTTIHTGYFCSYGPGGVPWQVSES